MMKVMIVGVGRLGSQVAFLTLLKFKPEKLILSDIRDLVGDILDLKHACIGLNIKTEITEKKEYCDFIIITAGVSRSQKIKTHEELYKINAPMMKEIAKDIEKCVKEDTKIIVLTNPVEKMTEIIKNYFNNNLVINPEKELIKMRNGKELGWDIIETKGYSSFGPSVAAILVIEKLENLQNSDEL